MCLLCPGVLFSFQPSSSSRRFGRPGGQQGRRKEGGVSVVRRMEVEGNDGV